MTNILFVCGKTRRRSPTAAAVAARLLEAETDFAGLSRDADECLGVEHLDWADIIAVMEKSQLSRLRRRFGARIGARRIVCLDIPDRCGFMQRDLVELLVRKLPRLFPAVARRDAGPGA